MEKSHHYYHQQVQQWMMPGAKKTQLQLLLWRRLAADAERKGG
jgi:hypothetical protein